MDRQIRIHALVFFDFLQLKPIEHKIYTSGKNKQERSFVSEFVDFGSKELLSHLETSDKEFVITLANGRIMIYITILDEIGSALLISSNSRESINLGNLPHIVSKKILMEYLNNSYVPNENDIFHWFKHKELLCEVNKTKKVLMRSISKVIERGENIDELVEKTELLSNSSKMFFHSSRKFNRCCWPFPRLFK